MSALFSSGQVVVLQGRRPLVVNEVRGWGILVVVGFEMRSGQEICGQCGFFLRGEVEGVY